MIILFILSSLFLQDVLAKPLQPLQPSQPLNATFDIPSFPHPLDIEFTQRSVGNIIWSCLTTVFVCLWVVVHPNIPGPSDSMFFTRLKIMGCMLIAPELVIVWAGRQWLAAREIATRHKGRGWTITHGFLASMGGFMLYSDGKMIKTLDIATLEQLYEGKRIRWPSISTKEIDDKSKGDFVSKGIAVIQTTWFVAQCIVRGVFKVSITQIELATVAFSALNIALSILWVYKPLGVAYPFRVDLQILPPESDTLHPPLSPHSESPLSLESDPLHPPSSPNSESPQSRVGCFLAYFSTRFKKKGLIAPIYIFIIEPFNLVWSSMEALITCEAIPPNQLSAPTFYAPTSTNYIIAPFIGLCVGISFGGIHCVAWYFQFPSSAEEIIWRTTAVTITTIPVVFFLIVENVRMQIPDAGFQDLSTRDFSRFRILIIYFLIVLYCISRVALVVLPILALRCLPPEALLEFQWSSFIPHI